MSFWAASRDKNSSDTLRCAAVAAMCVVKVYDEFRRSAANSELVVHLGKMLHIHRKI
jgi:hypothetical protein